MRMDTGTFHRQPRPRRPKTARARRDETNLCPTLACAAAEGKSGAELPLCGRMPQRFTALSRRLDLVRWPVNAAPFLRFFHRACDCVRLDSPNAVPRAAPHPAEDCHEP